MAIPQIAPLPPYFTLAPGYQVVVTAISATTGAEVAGVVISGVSIDVDRDTFTEPVPEQPKGPIFLIPGPLAA